MPEDLLSDFRVHACLREERRARVAQRVERESPGQRSQPERAAVFRTPALRAIRRALDVATARFSAAMLVFLDDAGAPESTPQNSRHVEVETALCAVALWEEPLRGGTGNSGLEVEAQRVRDRKRHRATALCRLRVQAARHGQRAGDQVHILSAQRDQLTAAKAEKQSRREYRPPLGCEHCEQRRNVLGRERLRLSLRFPELGQLIAVNGVRACPPAHRRQRRNRVEAPSVRAEVVEARWRELIDLRPQEQPQGSRGAPQRQLAEGRAKVLLDHRDDALRAQSPAVAFAPEIHQLAEGPAHVLGGRR